MAINNPVHRYQILLVEDNPADAMLAQEAIKDVDIPAIVTHAEDGQQALDKLEAMHDDGKRPDLILLDLCLPKVDGKAVLCAIRARPEFCSIPVLILTTSSSAIDVEYCQRHHANAYLIKPLSFTKFTEMLFDTFHFWLRWPVGDARKPIRART